MKIKGKLKLNYVVVDDFMGSRSLELNVTFKVPRHSFEEKLTRILVKGNKDKMDEFLTNCECILKSKELLLEEAKIMIREYLERNYQKEKQKEKEKYLEKLIEEFNRQNLEVEIEW